MNRYFYIDAQGKQKGTFSPEELRNENIHKESLVWTQGMAQWLPAASVAELLFLFNEQGQYGENQTTAPASQPYAGYTQPVNTATNISPMPKTWMLESILVTLLPFVFCINVFSLLGIIAIVKASQVESEYIRGDYASALQSSKDAGRWTKITFWISMGWLLLLILLTIIAIVSIGSFAGLADNY